MRRMGTESLMRFVLLIASCISLLRFWPLSCLPAAATPEDEYVYYAYIPPTLVNLTKPAWIGTTQMESIHNYTTFPSNLDMVGLEDDTRYELFDLSKKSLLRSGSLSKYEHLRISFGSRKTDIKPFDVQDHYLKLVTSKPVSALLWGDTFGAYQAMIGPTQRISQ